MGKEEYVPKTVDGKFMDGMKRKFNTKEKDKVKIKAETMESIMENVAQVPEKLSMVGAPDGSNQVKPVVPGINPMLTGDGKQMLKSTMDKKG